MTAIEFFVRRVAICSGLTVLLAAAAPAVNADPTGMDKVTVEAQRAREKLAHDVDDYVAAAMLQSSPTNESLARWTYKPVCPLVAGLGRAQGEFMLRRLSLAAQAAGAPLGPEDCKPNLFVLFTQDPERLLNAVWRHTPTLFNYQFGGEVRRFIATPRPVRVWYNIGTTSMDGAALVAGLQLGNSSVFGRQYDNEPIVNRLPSSLASRLTYSVTNDILSVIIVVDARRLASLGIGQLADYLSVVGLAQTNLDKDLGSAPTILNLFRGEEGPRPTEMSLWDRALLRALYNTPHQARLQLSEIQTAALHQIAAAPVQRPAQ
jgi:hypothetical protein